MKIIFKSTKIIYNTIMKKDKRGDKMLMFLTLLLIIAVIFIFADEKVKKIREENKEKNKAISDEVLKDFEVDIVKAIGDYEFLISKDHRELSIRYRNVDKVETPRVVQISNLAECEILKNGVTVSQNVLGRTVVGGILGGGAGAIVGGNTAKQSSVIERVDIKFKTKDIYNPLIKICLFKNSQVKEYDDIIYKCEELVEIINLLIEENNK